MRGSVEKADPFFISLNYNLKGLKNFQKKSNESVTFQKSLCH